VFDSLRRALGGTDDAREEELTQELEGVREALHVRQQMLEDRRQKRLKALFPDGPVPGWEAGRYPDLDPMNFEETEDQSWLITLATGIIDNFPGGEALLSQLDRTYRAFCDANHYLVKPGGPYSELLEWRDEILRCWDLQLEIPIYVGYGSKTEVYGCAEPFVLLDRLTFSSMPAPERRFMLATRLAHVFFGNLRIFSFHRLMEVLDKMPSVTGLITKGLGLLPVVGATISRGLELARSVNNQAIRKTNLVVGLRQHMLCDRLALLAVGDVKPVHDYFIRAVLGTTEHAEGTSVIEDLIEQGRTIHERFERGEVDLHMMSVVGPTSSFAAFRAYRLHTWRSDERSSQLDQGFYVTTASRDAYRRTHEALEAEIKALEARIVDLHQKALRLTAEHEALLQKKLEEESAPE
jgi:hypothetical protein